MKFMDEVERLLVQILKVEKTGLTTFLCGNDGAVQARQPSLGHEALTAHIQNVIDLNLGDEDQVLSHILNPTSHRIVDQGHG